MNIDINLENCDQEYRVALFLSAGAKNREWGVDNYCELVTILHSLCRMDLVLLGADANTEAYGIEMEVSNPIYTARTLFTRM